MAAIKPRDAALVLVITVGFVTFQVGADWARGSSRSSRSSACSKS